MANDGLSFILGCIVGAFIANILWVVSGGSIRINRHGIKYGINTNPPPETLPPTEPPKPKKILKG